MQSIHIYWILFYILIAYLLNFVSTYGTWTYLVLFLIIFCETGLVITPFLPGDSLLFVAGSIAAQPECTLIYRVAFNLVGYCIDSGNQLNYLIGRM